MDVGSAYLCVWRRRWRVLSVAAVFALLSCLAVVLTTSIFRASIVLLPAAINRSDTGGLSSALGQIGGLASLAGINVGSGNSDVTEALAVLQSRQFLEAFIADEKLITRMFARKWDASNGRWAVSEKNVPTAGDAYRYFTESVMDVDQDKKTGLVTVTIDWDDRQQAAILANRLIERLNAEMRERARVKAEASLKYLETELASTSEVSTREAIGRLVETQVRQRMLANVTEEYAFRVVDSAVVPDQKERIRPKPILWILGGTLLGLLLGAGYFVLVQRDGDAAA